MKNTIIIFLFIFFSFSCGQTEINEKCTVGFDTDDKATSYSENYGSRVHLNLEDAISCSKQTGKPILIMFTGWACIADWKAPWEILMVEEIKTIIEDNYTFLVLHVDDKTLLPLPDTLQSNEYGTKILNTIGQQNAYFQAVKFQSTNQPMYVVVNHNMEPVTNPISYTRIKDKQLFIDFLMNGIKP